MSCEDAARAGPSRPRPLGLLRAARSISLAEAAQGLGGAGGQQRLVDRPRPGPATGETPRSAASALDLLHRLARRSRAAARSGRAGGRSASPRVQHEAQVGEEVLHLLAARRTRRRPPPTYGMPLPQQRFLEAAGSGRSCGRARPRGPRARSAAMRSTTQAASWNSSPAWCSRTRLARAASPRAGSCPCAARCGRRGAEAASRMRLGGAVVLLQAQHARAREVVLEVEDVLDVGAAPGVDRLVLVADHRDVAPRPARRRTSSYCARFVSWYSSTRR